MSKPALSLILLAAVLLAGCAVTPIQLPCCDGGLSGPDAGARRDIQPVSTPGLEAGSRLDRLAKSDARVSGSDGRAGDARGDAVGLDGLKLDGKKAEGSVPLPDGPTPPKKDQSKTGG